MSTPLQMFLLSLAMLALQVSGRNFEEMKFDSLEADNEGIMSAEIADGNGRAKNWLSFTSVGTDISEDWNYHELYHNSKPHHSHSSSSSESRPVYDHNMDCDKLKQIYEHESQKFRISNQICQMNISQYENLAHECMRHLEEDDEEVSDLADLLNVCEADVKAIKMLIDSEKQKSSTCEDTNSDLESKVMAQQQINSDFLTMNLGLADQLGFCQDDVYDCQVDINTCLDSCSP